MIRRLWMAAAVGILGLLPHRAEAHWWQAWFVTTAYCQGTRTYEGTLVGYGTIAVDPRIVPFWRHLYVPDYGRGRALDTGGAIKGYRLDLFFPNCRAAVVWGVRTKRVRIW